MAEARSKRIYFGHPGSPPQRWRFEPAGVNRIRRHIHLTPRVSIIPVFPPAARSIILARLALPTSDARAVEYSRALFAVEGAEAVHAGIASRSDIPDGYREKGGLRKESREALAGTAIKRAARTVKRADFILKRIIFDELSRTRGVPFVCEERDRGSIARAIEGFERKLIAADCDGKNISARLIAPLRRVMHLAHAVGQLGLPNSEMEVIALVQYAETARRYIAEIGGSKFGREMLKFEAARIEENPPEI